MFSFQAIKHITTGDGGMVTFPANNNILEMGKRLRWFGIDRSAKQKGIWENDITEIGYKYQMNDISAALGLAALEDFDEKLIYRQLLFKTYVDLLSDFKDVKIVGGDIKDRTHAAWMFTIIVEKKNDLMKKLRDNNIESAQVHYRNDRYSIFGGRGKYPNMDSVEDKYLVLPLHTKMDVLDVKRICNLIKQGW